MWEERLQELLAFRAAHDTPNVPRRWPENPRLAHWVVNQRRQIRNGTLSPERLKRFQDLGISWTSAQERAYHRERHWNRMLEALAVHRDEHGHFDVPGGPGELGRLARWVACQRHHFRRGTLRPDRRRRLELLGVDWTPDRGRSRTRDLAWNRMFDALMTFSQRYGHCRVPKSWPENPKLARWTNRQRHDLRLRVMRLDRRSRLEELGLDRPLPPSAPVTPSPGRRERAWQTLYAMLEAFRRTHGHCAVPRRWAWNPQLARWVHHQKDLHRRGLLRRNHEQLLNRLGFAWSSSSPALPVAAARSR